MSVIVSETLWDDWHCSNWECWIWEYIQAESDNSAYKQSHDKKGGVSNLFDMKHCVHAVQKKEALHAWPE